MSKEIEQLLKLESGDKKAAEKAISLETSKGIHILVKFILIINESPMQGLNIGKINRFCWIFGFIIVMAWLLNIGDLPGYLEGFLPWCNI